MKWLLAVLAIATTYAQPHFDVASVKPSRATCQGRWDFSTSHDTLTAENAPLLRIVSRAFHLADDRVSGPAWLESQCFDIKAKGAGSDLMPMLQTLLAERFHFTAHIESEVRPISVLVVEKGGSKLHAYGDKVPTPSQENGKVVFMVRHLPDLCERLGKVTGRPVVDKTGLTGDYLIMLTYSMSDPGDILAALRDQLGLKLESQRGPVEILKIDRIDKVPVGN